MKNKIEICVGIGLDQLTPEYVVIEIPNSKEDAPKKRGRKPKAKKEIEITKD